MADTETKEVAVALTFDPAQKKKKKKKKVETAETETAVEEVAEKVAEVQVKDGEDGGKTPQDAESAPKEEGAPGATAMDPSLEAMMDFGKKKKKKNTAKVKFGETEDLVAVKEKELAEKAGENGAEANPWDGSERDYTYQELIQRAFQFLHGKHAGNEPRKTFRSRPPQVKKEGKKKTLILNFSDICKGYRRQPEHLLAYLSAELGTTGSLQSNGSLVIKGNFDEAGIESVLKRYIKEYVACGSCHSPDTVLIRDASTRLYFLQCESCGASRSVAGIRQGYLAQIGKRKH